MMQNTMYCYKANNNVEIIDDTYMAELRIDEMNYLEERRRRQRKMQKTKRNSLTKIIKALQLMKEME